LTRAWYQDYRQTTFNEIAHIPFKPRLPDSDVAGMGRYCAVRAVHPSELYARKPQPGGEHLGNQYISVFRNPARLTAAGFFISQIQPKGNYT
jgi:hypothetical protein